MDNNAESFDYSYECDMCGTTTLITVLDVDEKPVFCPMCGSEYVE